MIALCGISPAKQSKLNASESVHPEQVELSPAQTPHSSVSFVAQSGSASKQSTIVSPSESIKSFSPGQISSLSQEPSLSESSNRSNGHGSTSPHCPSESISLSASYGHSSTSPQISSPSASFSASNGHSSKSPQIPS